ncbi:MAG: hypothetical protein IPJ84_01030 [Bdellovibrionales bacterium]|nr:hypothetical protein [Bdellovibrionales bacterium]
MLETVFRWKYQRPPVSPLVLPLAIVIAALVGCSGTRSTEQASRSPSAPYCSVTSPNKGTEKIRGIALYESRLNGNGAASDSGLVFSVTSFSTPTNRIYSVEVNGALYSVESSLSGNQGVLDVVAKLKTLINSASVGLYAYGNSQLNVTAPDEIDSPAVGAATNLTHTATHASAKPVRYAEVALLNADGSVAACTETSDKGEFEFTVEDPNKPYVVEVRSRAYNGMNTAYVLDAPMTGQFHALRKPAANRPLILRARVHGDLKAGAFNILDQILRAQEYLRISTADCDLPNSPTFFAGCMPFSTAPLVNIYWSAGVSPGIYYGSDQAISYYLNGQRELYIQGGDNGNVVSSDMDHFDDAVILHEYGHFIEDVFGRPNSPGGTHDGNSIIDPRLAWGEGWADYFQAAVTGNPIYRDTYGTPDCSSLCAGVFYNTSLDPSGAAANDVPTANSKAEGNFREFSISRVLWDVTKPGGVSQFSEVWRLFVEPQQGMRVVADPFKHIGSIHELQGKLPGATNWTALVSNEEQSRGSAAYGTPLTMSSSCATNPITITPNRGPGDYGSFETSDLLRSNDFYRIEHSGGPLNIELRYTKNADNPVDLDLYIYRTRYVFGRASDMLASSALVNDSGLERASTVLSQGTYLINVFADTSVAAKAPGANTQYVLRLNGSDLCPVTTPY